MKIDIKIRQKHYICYFVLFKHDLHKQVEVFYNYAKNTIFYISVSDKRTVKRSYLIKGGVLL